MTATRVRPAEARDAAAIARIYNQGIEDRIATFETEPRTAQQVLSWIRNAEQYPIVVAEREGEVVAWAGTSTYRPRACYAGIAEFSIYTDRTSRGTGAGKAALGALLRFCEERGFWKLVSRIIVENGASRGLCRSLGFREVGVYVRHGKLDGEWRDVVIVERLLGEARE
jgi:phosphinothricin acetyltransferase